MDLLNRIVDQCVSFGHSKSGGHGGQKINKKQSKASLRFDLGSCDLIDERTRDILERVYHNWVNHDGILVMTCQEERSWHANKRKVISHFKEVMRRAMAGDDRHLYGWHAHHSKHHHKHH